MHYIRSYIYICGTERQKLPNTYNFSFKTFTKYQPFEYLYRWTRIHELFLLERTDINCTWVYTYIVF